MKAKKPKSIAEVFEEGTLIDKALDEAIHDAILLHQKLGRPLAASRGGKVVWVKPEDLLRRRKKLRPKRKVSTKRGRSARAAR